MDNVAGDKPLSVLKPSFDLKSDGGLTQWMLRDTVMEDKLILDLLGIILSNDPNFPGRLKRICRGVKEGVPDHELAKPERKIE